MKFWTDFRPATGALAALVCFLAVGAAAETTNTLSDAEIQGRQLARQICSARPSEYFFTNTGILKIQDGKGIKYEFTLKCITKTQGIDWESSYVATLHSNKDLIEYTLLIFHLSQRPYEYHWQPSSRYQISSQTPAGFSKRNLKGDETMVAFANSDFWIADLGLEFFHWPAQKVLPNPTSVKRGRAYTLLESTNPNPATNGYSRVLSWIDKETGGILEAEAYDFNGRLLKDFAPKSFKKVNGQWELQEMEIRNVQTGSRTRLEFDLTK
jgi:hypothetical protein